MRCKMPIATLTIRSDTLCNFLGLVGIQWNLQADAEFNLPFTGIFRAKKRYFSFSRQSYIRESRSETKRNLADVCAT
jgi:hypothetical protein